MQELRATPLSASKYGEEINDSESEPQTEILESEGATLFQVWSSEGVHA